MGAPPSGVVEKMRSLWERARYHRNMASAFIVPPPSSKFRRLYHLTTAEYAISDIALRRLKVALLTQLNDPFELQAAKLEANFVRLRYTHVIACRRHYSRFGWVVDPKRKEIPH